MSQCDSAHWTDPRLGRAAVLWEGQRGVCANISRTISMADYRLYYRRDGQILGREDFSAVSDEIAVVFASELRAGSAAELWGWLRKIWTFEAHPDPGSAKH